MKAVNIGKTIIVWNKLSEEEAARLVNSLKNIILNYRELTQHNAINRPVPIILANNDNYLCVIKKHNEIMVCATKTSDKNMKNYPYVYNAILNATFLYESIDLLENAFDDLESHINILQRFPETKWIELPFNKSFEHYCLTPNINPENFIRHLKDGTLSEMSKQFLQDVEFSLENSAFSKELCNSIKEANELFIER